MGFRNTVNDGTTNAPRLRLQGAWPMGDSAGGSIAERLEKIAAAGLTGLEGSCGTEGAADELGEMLRDRNIGFGFSSRVSDVDDLLVPIDLAHRMHADYLSVQVIGSLKASPEIAEILEEMFELVNDAGLPLFVQTHRGTVTQDLRRTVKVVDRFKKVRFTGDFSQYEIAAAMTGPWSEEVWEHFRPIAARCGNWRGRVHGDIGDEQGELAQQYKKLWSMGMAAWLKKSEPGDVLPFTCETGGAPEAVIMRLAAEAWAAAELAAQPAEPPPQTVEVKIAPAVQVASEPSRIH